MIKKFAEFINEDFTDLYKRWKKKDVRKEDNLEIKLKQFISTTNNPEEYYIENGLVCCKGDVVIDDNDLIDGKFPFQFCEVEGDFICSYCKKLTSLKGAPQEVVGDFYCCDCGKKFTKLDLPNGTIIRGEITT